jgi:hypothetical protein
MNPPGRFARRQRLGIEVENEENPVALFLVVTY